MSGNPAIMYGIRAARRCGGMKSGKPLWPAGASAILAQDLGQVLVAAPAERDECEAPCGWGLAQHPRDRVSRLQGRDDPLQARELAEGAQRLGIGDRLVTDAARVAQERVLRADAGVVQPRRYGMRLEDLPVGVLEHRGQRTVQHALPAGTQRGSVP